MKKNNKIWNITKIIFYSIGVLSEYLYRLMTVIVIWYAFVNWFGSTPRLGFMLLGFFYIFFPLISRIRIIIDRNNVSRRYKEQYRRTLNEEQ